MNQTKFSTTFKWLRLQSRKFHLWYLLNFFDTLNSDSDLIASDDGCHKWIIYYRGFCAEFHTICEYILFLLVILRGIIFVRGSNFIKKIFRFSKKKKVYFQNWGIF